MAGKAPSNINPLILTKLRENTTAPHGLYLLDLTSSQIGPRELSVLGEVIKQNGLVSEGMAPLTAIDLTRNRLCGISPSGRGGAYDTDGLADFFTSLVALNKVSRLRSLTLSWNDLNFKAFTLLSNFLVNGPSSLVELHVQACGMSDEAAERLLEGVRGMNKDRGLQSLNISQNPIGRRGAIAVAEYISSSSSSRLRQLNLNGCLIESEGTDAIFRALTNSSVEVLSMNNNAIGDSGCDAIAAMLRKNTKLRHLDLQENHINLEGVSYITKALVRNGSLTFLGLQWNDISNEGASRFAEALSQNTTLKAIHLLGNHIDLDGIKLIVNATLSRTDRPIDLDLGFAYRPKKVKTERKVIKEASPDEMSMDYDGSSVGLSGIMDDL